MLYSARLDIEQFEMVGSHLTGLEASWAFEERLLEHHILRMEGNPRAVGAEARHLGAFVRLET